MDGEDTGHNFENDEDDAFHPLDDEEVITDVQDLLLIELDIVTFQQGDYMKVKKQIGDKIFNSSLLIVAYTLFLY